MLDPNKSIIPDNTFFHRILRHDAARKGAAAAIAGVLVAAVSEALWPTE
jgi:hypothetical protein